VDREDGERYQKSIIYRPVMTCIITWEDCVTSCFFLSGFLQKNNPYFGAVIGRVANRIGGAKFTLNGIQYNLTQNEGSNQLHGGLRGFDKVRTMTVCWYKPSSDFELSDDLVKSQSPGFAVEFLGTMCQDYGADWINFTSIWECDYMLTLT